MRQKIASIAQRLRMTTNCVLCQQYHRDPFAICQNCSDLLKTIENPCNYCAFPLANANFLLCGRCSKQQPFFDKTFTNYYFEEPLRTLLHEYKYQGGLYMRTLLARLMLDAINDDILQTECLIPVPLHRERLQERGFNQAAELAKLLAKKLKIPCELNLCKKIINTNPQVSLSGKERRKNLQNAFQSKITNYQRVTLVDDLLTTGSTVNALASILKKQGVRSVYVWCCARAVY